MTRDELRKSLAFQVPTRTPQEIELLITNAVHLTPESIKSFFSAFDQGAMTHLKNVEQRYFVANGTLYIGEEII